MRSNDEDGRTLLRDLLVLLGFEVHEPKPFRQERLLDLLCAHLELARRGDVKSLLAQASRLEQSGAGYAPFAAELRCLVEGFQMKQLREWLKSLGEAS
jgi:hypothetical protein